MRAAYLLSPSFITRGRMGAIKAALILVKNSHFDRTLQYLKMAFFIASDFSLKSGIIRHFGRQVAGQHSDPILHSVVFLHCCVSGTLWLDGRPADEHKPKPWVES